MVLDNRVNPPVADVIVRPLLMYSTRIMIMTIGLIRILDNWRNQSGKDDRRYGGTTLIVVKENELSYLVLNRGCKISIKKLLT